MNVVDASPQSSIRSWTHSDVKGWLKDVGLEDRWVCVSNGPGIDYRGAFKTLLFSLSPGYSDKITVL